MYILIILLSLFIIAKNGFFSSKKKASHSVVDILFVLLVLFIGTFRDTSVGTDIALNSGGYHDFWKNPIGYERDLEPGFRMFTYFIKSISSSYYFYYSLVFALNCLFYYLACKRMRIGFPLFMAILFMSSLLTPSFNVIRQMLGLSIGIYLYSLFYFDKPVNIRNVLIYEVLTLSCALLVHTSVALLCVIPLLDLPSINRLFTKTWFLSLLALFSVLLSKYGVSYIVQYLARFSGVFGERADFWILVTENYELDRSHGFVTDAINFILLIVLSHGRRNNLFKIGFLGCVLSCIAAAALGTLGRAFDNLLIFTCFYYAQNWRLFIPNSKMKAMTYGAMMLRIVFWITGVYFTVLLNETLSPYSSYLF